MAKIKIIVVEDHPLFRQGVVNTFSIVDEFEVVGETSDGENGLLLTRELKPDILILDINLPKMNGHQIMCQIVKEKIPTKVIFLTAYDDVEQIIHAIREGASAYCAKHIDPEQLVNIIKLVIEGKYVIGDKVYDKKSIEAWVDSYSRGQTKNYSDPGRPLKPLSKREMDVLVCLTQGLSNKEIALKLQISHQTVKNHVTSILRKLMVEDRTQAAVYAIRQGWVRLHDYLDS
ncbi:MAG TPA: response regulator transcription factor [Anaerolineae bacterium]|nr:response regulator transcription factor [Anaerolineae bacterium]